MARVLASGSVFISFLRLSGRVGMDLIVEVSDSNTC